MTKLTVGLLKGLIEGLSDTMLVEHWIGSPNGTSMRVATSCECEGQRLAIVRNEGARRPPDWDSAEYQRLGRLGAEAKSLTLGELRQAIEGFLDTTEVEHWTVLNKHVTVRVARYEQTESLLRVSSRTRFVIYALLNEEPNG